MGTAGVQVRSMTVGGRMWWLVFAEVCAIEQYEHAAMLAHGATLGVGGVVSWDGRYWIQHAVPTSASAADLEAAKELIAHEAARLREARGVAVGDGEVFAHFGE